MNQETKKLTDDMSDKISKHVQDPRGWPLEARRVAESLDLHVGSLKLFAPTLDAICFDIVRAAVDDNRTEHEIRSAIEEIATRDRS